MEKIRLLGLDLDGTLLTEKKTISPRTLAALRAAAAQGVQVVPVTGRPYGGIPRSVLTLPGAEYCICSNGATVRSIPGEKTLWRTHIPPELSRQLLRRLEAEPVACFVYWEGVGYGSARACAFLERKYRDSPLLPYLRHTRRLCPVPPLDFLRAGEKWAEEFLVMAESSAQRDAVAERLRDLSGLDVTCPFSADLEITAAGADKGRCLLELAARLDIPRESVMAVGDRGNDLSLLACAGFPVAMGNATPEVKARARFVTASNEEDGVALAVERFVLGQG